MRKYTQEEKQFLVKLGRKIQATRKGKGMIQQDIAALCDSEKAHFSRIESGKTNSTIMTLGKIAAALQVPVSDLF